MPRRALPLALLMTGLAVKLAWVAVDIGLQGSGSDAAAVFAGCLLAVFFTTRMVRR